MKTATLPTLTAAIATAHLEDPWYITGADFAHQENNLDHRYAWALLRDLATGSEDLAGEYRGEEVILTGSKVAGKYIV